MRPHFYRTVPTVDSECHHKSLFLTFFRSRSKWLARRLVVLNVWSLRIFVNFFYVKDSLRCMKIPLSLVFSLKLFVTDRLQFIWIHILLSEQNRATECHLVVGSATILQGEQKTLQTSQCFVVVKQHLKNFSSVKMARFKAAYPSSEDQLKYNDGENSINQPQVNEILFWRTFVYLNDPSCHLVPSRVPPEQAHIWPQQWI